MKGMDMYTLTAADKKFYEDQGYLLLRQILPVSVQQEIRKVFAGVVDRQAREWLAQGKITDLCENLPFETRYDALRRQYPVTFSNSWRRIIVSEPIYKVWQTPELIHIMRSMLGDELFASGTFNGRPRVAGQMIQTIDWHQDAHYYKDWAEHQSNIISCWMPLVPVRERTGCLQVIPGFHKLGLRKQARLPRNGLVGISDEDTDGREVFTCDMDPGDILLFGPLMAHRATENHGPNIRWSLDIRYCPTSAGITKIDKLGYRCFSAKDPSSVESYEAWSSKFTYEGEH